MRKIILDIEKMRSLPMLHKYLHTALALPEYYGANLDALYDCLTEIAEPTELVVPKKVRLIWDGMDSNFCRCCWMQQRLTKLCRLSCNKRR